ncbi:MAG TPA: glycosyltransferase N-terminal domain-containing protein [Tenuifilaceae bacterium]|nr:glycosyltransferase N-terminal domain-containing protein [Tenuifilaceae bacterium]
MVLIYNLGIRIYLLLIWLVSPVNPKAKSWLAGRRGLLDEVELLAQNNDPKIWVHCSSLGEFEQGRPLIERIRESYPTLKVVLTFFSPSGYKVRKNYSGADYIFYLPLDTKRNAKRFVEAVKPKMAIFVKYEFWYHFLSELHAREIPTYLISANFRETQIFFKPYGRWYRKFLSHFTHIFVQNHRSLELLNSVGIKEVTVTGDTRFDRVSRVASESATIPLLNTFCDGEKVIVAGSTWPKDEELLLNYLSANADRVKMIIAPHEISPSRVGSIVSASKVEAICFTRPEGTSPKQARLLVLDTIGFLSSTYRYGCLAYIGGGFGAGIHNTLEAAVFGIPVVFGPNYLKFQEAMDLIALGAGFSIKSQAELNDLLDRLLNDPTLLSQAGESAGAYVKSGVGSSEKILSIISNRLNKML